MPLEWNIERLQFLIEKYLRGQCNEQEASELESWYQSLGQDIEPYSNDENKEKLRTEIFNAVVYAKQESGPATGFLKSIPGQRRGSRRVLLFAALFILLAGLAITIYLEYFTPGRSEFVTAYGKIDTLLLPDNSKVILNGNSKLTYKKIWKSDEPRELWLEGEALFKIVHVHRSGVVKPNERLIVHVADLNIEVLGTIFNVRQRRSKTEIVLQEGSVKVSFLDRAQADIFMHPDQLVTIDVSQEQIVKANARTEDYTAWTKRKLILSDPVLKDFTEYLEDNYGKKISFSDTSLAHMKIGGTLIIDNLDDALLILSKTLNLKVVEENNTLFISPK